jgi:hypothetical protein
MHGKTVKLKIRGDMIVVSMGLASICNDGSAESLRAGAAAGLTKVVPPRNRGVHAKNRRQRDFASN